VRVSYVVFQDDQLRSLVEIWGSNNWQCVAEFIRNRSDIQCQHRWEKFLSPELVKGSWTKEARKHTVLWLFIYRPSTYVAG